MDVCEQVVSDKDANAFYSFPYLKDFTCIGPDCPDSCCKGWDIRLDKKSFMSLKDRMNVSPEERQRFMKSVSITTGDNANSEFASLRHDSNGSCSFLDYDQLCFLQKKYGQEVLTPTCAFYPRVFSQVGDMLEVTGALSCPEMARLCILEQTISTMVKMPEEILPRMDDWPLSRSMPMEDAAPYNKNFIKIRDVLVSLLKLKSFPINFRLFLMTVFSNQLGEQFFRGAETIDDSWLDTKIDSILDNDNIRNIHEQFHVTSEDESLVMMLVFSFLKGRIDQGGDHKLVAIVRSVFETYEKKACTSMHSQAFSQQLWRYSSRFKEEHFHHELNQRMDEMLSNYCLNHMHREWFTGYPHLLGYIHMMIVRVAMLQFLYINHPWIMKSVDSGQKIEVTLLEAVAVDVTYSFSKSIDHNLDYLRAIYESMEQEGLISFEYSSPFTRF